MDKREMIEKALGRLSGIHYPLLYDGLAEQAIVMPVKIKQQRFIEGPSKSKVYYSIGYKAWRYCFGVTGEYPEGKALAIVLPLEKEEDE